MFSRCSCSYYIVVDHVIFLSYGVSIPCQHFIPPFNGILNNISWLKSYVTKLPYVSMLIKGALKHHIMVDFEQHIRGVF